MFVLSKIEYIIYNKLSKSGIRFQYEEALKFDGVSYAIHPDFTLYLQDGRKVFWEHLGMLDSRKYYSDWQRRKTLYFNKGFKDFLVTTDDIEGVHEDKIDQVIRDIRSLNLAQTKDNKFSDHHYRLYN